MKNKEDKNLEKLVENLMAEATLASPSIDFTSNVMSGVKAVEKRKSFVYKPVISKWAWLIIMGSIVFLFAFIIMDNPQSASAKGYFNVTFFNFEKMLKSFPEFQISTMTANVLLAATLMILIQIFFLKNYLNKRFER
ncbi:MAG: hypothetical protein ABI267_11060 [Ginsengibacter sp.]